jgi:hypothetical protein
LAVKKAFADNLYMNIFPRKAESINGSDYISNYPDLSQALKQCARLKKQFLPYFVEGTLVGDCLLTKPLNGAHVCSYTLPDRALMVFINTSPSRINIECDVNLAPWIRVAAEYEIKQYDENGKQICSTKTEAAWHGTLKSLEPGEMALIECTGK